MTKNINVSDNALKAIVTSMLKEPYNNEVFANIIVGTMSDYHAQLFVNAFAGDAPKPLFEIGSWVQVTTSVYKQPKGVDENGKRLSRTWEQLGLGKLVDFQPYRQEDCYVVCDEYGDTHHIKGDRITPATAPEELVTPVAELS